MPIYFIRHGQSEFNAHFPDVYDGDTPDPLIFDPRLSELGRAQALALRERAHRLGVSRVVTSPLSRAVETALCLFDGVAPIEVDALHREKVAHSGDVGRDPAELARDFPQLGFAHIPERWWHAGPENRHGVPVEPEDIFIGRVRAFERRMDAIAGESVAVIGHGSFFETIVGRMLGNCEIHIYRP